MAAAATLSFADGYAALAEGAVAVRGEVAVAWVEGPDASSFLHGLLTQDILAIDPGQATPALLLDVKGRVRSAMRVHRDGPEAFTLVLRTQTAAETMAELEGFHFSEALDLLGPEPSALLTISGVAPAAASQVADLVLPGTVPGTLDLVVGDAEAALAALGVPETSADALRCRRIEAGAPIVGVDTTNTTLVQEAGLETSAVSFEKGCYLGQETVARAAHRGGVRRALRGLAFETPVPAGAQIVHEGREVGIATSTAVSPARGPVALAILRREAEPGATIDADGTPGRVIELPFR